MVLLNEGPTNNLPDSYKFRSFMFFILIECDNINLYFFSLNANFQRMFQDEKIYIIFKKINNNSNNNIARAI